MNFVYICKTRLIVVQSIILCVLIAISVSTIQLYQRMWIYLRRFDIVNIQLNSKFELGARKKYLMNVIYTKWLRYVCINLNTHKTITLAGFDVKTYTFTQHHGCSEHAISGTFMFNVSGGRRILLCILLVWPLFPL